MNAAKTAAPQHSKTYEMTVTALMTAVTCILAPLSIPIGPVPISFTNLAIYLSLYLLGWKRGTISYLVYLLIGLVGVPVFSGFTGGLDKDGNCNDHWPYDQTENTLTPPNEHPALFYMPDVLTGSEK